MVCEDVQKLIHPYVDGEFSPDEKDEFERHLQGCRHCRELATYQLSFKATLKAKLKGVTAPPELLARVREELAATPTPLVGWRRSALKVAPVAAAAVVFLAFGVSWQHHRGQTDAVVASSVARHINGLPVEIASPDGDSVRSWFQGKVPFSVHAPHLPSGQLVGARMSNLRDHDAAYLVYDVKGSKVSVFVFDPAQLDLDDGDDHLVVHGHDVYLGARSGYNVALYRDHGVGYAITGDVNQPEMLRLVSASLSQ